MLPVYFGTTVLLVNGLNKGKHQRFIARYRSVYLSMINFITKQITDCF